MSTFHAYEIAIQLVETLAPLLRTLRTQDSDLAKQGRKAASSVALNVAEGNRRAGGDRTHHFRIAAGSADEVRATLDVAQAWGYLKNDAQLQSARKLLDRQLAVLWRLTHPRTP